MDTIDLRERVAAVLNEVIGDCLNAEDPASEALAIEYAVDQIVKLINTEKESHDEQG